MIIGSNNAKSKKGSEIPVISIDVSQVLSESEIALTQEQYDVLLNNFIVIGEVNDGTKAVFIKTIIPQYDSYYLIFNCTMINDADTGTSTMGQLWINKSTLHATIGAQDLKVVNANPTLDGTEASLTSIKIGDSNYAVGGGGGKQLYQHNISIKVNDTNNNINVYFTIINNSPTQFTAQSVYNYLSDNNFDGVKCLMATGFQQISGANHTITGLYKGSNQYIDIIGTAFAEYNQSNGFSVVGVSVINDIVITL